MSTYTDLPDYEEPETLVPLSSVSNEVIAKVLLSKGYTCKIAYDAQKVANMVMPAYSYQEVLKEYSARTRKSGSLMGADRFFTKVDVIVIGPGVMKVENNKKEEPAGYVYGIPLIKADKQAMTENCFLSQASALLTTCYNEYNSKTHESRLVVPDSKGVVYINTPFISENDAHSPYYERYYKAIHNVGPIITQRNALARVLLSQPNPLAHSCALMSKIDIGDKKQFAIKKDLSPETHRFLLTLNLPEKKMPRYEYTRAPFPRNVGPIDSIHGMYAQVGRHREARGHDSKKFAGLCKPMYLGELPDQMYTGVHDAFCISHIMKMMNLTRIKLGAGFMKASRDILAMNYVVHDDYQPSYVDEDTGFYCLTKKARGVHFFKSPINAPSVTGSKVVFDTQEVSVLDRLLVMFSKLEIETFALVPGSPSVFAKFHEKVWPFAKGHTGQVWVSNQRCPVKYTEKEYIVRTAWFNVWRTYYPYHRTAIWIYDGFCKDMPPLLIMRKKTVAPELYELGLDNDWEPPTYTTFELKAMRELAVKNRVVYDSAVCPYPVDDLPDIPPDPKVSPAPQNNSYNNEGGEEDALGQLNDHMSQMGFDD